MKIDDLRALLDAAAKATPGKWETEESPFSVVVRRESWDQVVATTPQQCNRDYIAAASPDVVAALARIALAAVEVSLLKTAISHAATQGSEAFIDACIKLGLAENAMNNALRDAGLLAPAPQEPQP